MDSNPTDGPQQLAEKCVQPLSDLLEQIQLLNHHHAELERRLASAQAQVGEAHVCFFVQ